MSSETRVQSTQSTGTQYVAENGEVSNQIRSMTAIGLVRNGTRKSSAEASEAPALRESLVQMIRRLTPNSSLREDLLQEAMIHLWRTETRRPGQTRSWYLQSCRFHLQHYLNCGRSIDSTKRWRDQLPLSESSDEATAE